MHFESLHETSPAELVEQYKREAYAVAVELDYLPTPLAATVGTPHMWITFHENYRAPFDAVRACMGDIPYLLDPRNPLSALDQLKAATYWHDFKGFTVKGLVLQYPGDPDLLPLGGTVVNGDLVLVYPFDWVVVVRDGGRGEMAVSRVR
jgi:hypothetical protein